MTKQEMIAAGLQRVSHAARFLGVSRSKIYDLMDEGQLPYVLIGRTRRIPIKAVEELAISNLVTKDQK